MMNRKGIALLLASGLTAGAAAAEGPYFGLGYQNLQADMVDVTLDTAVLTGGWQVNENFALEASYTTTLSKDSSGLALGGNQFVDDVRVRHGWIASAIGSLPITENLSAYARVGWGWHRMQLDIVDAGTGAEMSDRSWVDDPVFGAGLRAQISPMGEVRAEWTRLFDDSNVNATGLSFTYVQHIR